MSTLYIVATPIGNLEDITLRALKILQQVELIAAEDTRHSARLLSAHGIQTRMVSLHDHNESQRASWLIKQMAEGRSVALISDAGTPLISDPGYRLVVQAREAGFQVVPVPGPSAVITALCASGLATDQFLFAGFLPAKSVQRKERLRGLATQTATLVFYESPRRILELLADVGQVLGAQRTICVAKELTKTHENFLVGNAAQLEATLLADPVLQKGEFVVLVAGDEPALSASIDQATLDALREAQAFMPLKKACALVAGLTGFKKNQLYEAALAFDRHSG